LAATLQRCAFAYASASVEIARAYFKESVALFRSLGRDDETARALSFWADAEGAAGNWSMAASIVQEALEIGGADSRLYFNNALAALYVALGDRDRAERAARETLRLALEEAHPIATPQAMLYLAAATTGSEPKAAASLFGYAQAQLQRLNWVSDGVDRAVESRLQEALREHLDSEMLASLRAAGASWSEAEALAVVTRL
jgi:Flp pilus assembly protein TadD